MSFLDPEVLSSVRPRHRRRQAQVHRSSHRGLQVSSEPRFGHILPEIVELLWKFGLVWSVVAVHHTS